VRAGPTTDPVSRGLEAVSVIDAGSNAGELAALCTALCWTGTAFCFQAAGRAIGSLTVNLLRLMLALVLLSLLGWALRGHAWPSDASAHAWVWLSISGLFGFALGDLCLFRAFVLLGARRSTLVMSLVPPMTACVGWVALVEVLSLGQITAIATAIALTVTGVILAVRERADAGTGVSTEHAPAEPGKGLLLALGGAVGQAAGLVLSKYGMGDYHPLAATQIRVTAGIAGFAVVFTAVGWWPRLWDARRSPRGLAFTALGALLGPVTGVTLSLYAVQHTATGVAASIMALTPILVIPVAAIVYRERVTARSVLGAMVAVVGVVLLFLLGGASNDGEGTM
jgi:drug/metabolite transporter (DMT)-like permease